MHTLPLRSPTFTGCLSAIILLALGSTAHAAQPGDPDPGFGNGGSTAIDFGDTSFSRLASSLRTIRTQSNGYIVGVGQLANRAFVGRWNPDGQVDTSFGDGGSTVLAGAWEQEVYSLTIQADGRILVGGWISDNAFRSTATGFVPEPKKYNAVWRLESNGQPDLTWNLGRPFVFSVESNPQTYAPASVVGVLPQADGSVAAIGSVVTSTGIDIGIQKITASGQADTSFATNGLKTINIGNGDVYLFGAIQAPDGKFLVTGEYYASGTTGNQNSGMLVARFTSDGNLDASFNGNGRRVQRFSDPTTPTFERGFDLALQSTGAIVVAGRSQLARFTPNGAVDSTFGTAAAPYAGHTPFIGDVVNVEILGDDRIVVAGSVGGAGTQMNLARYAADGKTRQFLTSANATGQVTFKGRLALLPDGRAILGGGVQTDASATSITPFTVALTRFNINGSKDTTFGGARAGIVTAVGAKQNELVSGLTLDGNRPIIISQSRQDEIGASNRFFLAAVARLTPQGALDSAFSSDGKLLLRIGTATEGIGSVLENYTSVAVDSQRRLILGGYQLTYDVPSKVAFIRLTPAGVLDTSFNGTGRVEPTIQPGNALLPGSPAVAVQADDKVLTAINFQTGSSTNNLKLSRYTTAGVLDTTFNSTGTIDLLPKFTLAAVRLAVQGDGKILVAGVPAGTTVNDLQVARFTSTGAYDSTFGTNGVAAVDLGTGVPQVQSDAGGIRVLVQADGKILLYGKTYVVRLTTAGVLDTSFNSTGKQFYDPTTGADYLGGIAQQADGKLILAGTVNLYAVEPRIRVSRHNLDGSLDTTFGNAGSVTRDYGDVRGVAIQTGGNILVAATSDSDARVFTYLQTGNSDPIAILADRTTLNVGEGNVATLGVRLGSAPTGSVTVNAAFAGGGDPDLRVVGGASLTFTAANWNVLQVISIAAQADVDTSNGSANLVLSGSGLTSDTVAVSEVDNGLLPVQINVATASLAIPEGGSNTLAVRLTSAPATNVIIAAALQNGFDPDLSISGGASLTFTPANWNVSQNVTIAAATDADTLNGSGTLRLSSTNVQDVYVTVSEADAGAPPIAAISLGGAATEGGPAGSFIVSLSRTSGSAVSVVFAVDGTSSASGADYTVSQSSPVVIPAGQTSATISVTAVADGLAEGTETLRINLAPGTGYTLSGGSNQAAIDIIDGVAGNVAPTISRSATAASAVVSLP